MSTQRRPWTCPTCGQRWSIPATAAAPPSCPKCQAASEAANSAPAFDPDAVLSALRFEVPRTSTGRRQDTASVLFGLLDWRFQNFLTPMIIRIIWIALLSIVITGLVTEVAAIGFEVITGESLADAVSYWLEQKNDVQEDPRPGWKFRFRDSPRLRTALVAVPLTTGAVMVLLCVRVCCEFAIVVFNIAGSLQRMEANSPQTNPGT